MLYFNYILRKNKNSESIPDKQNLFFFFKIFYLNLSLYSNMFWKIGRKKGRGGEERRGGIQFARNCNFSSITLFPSWVRGTKQTEDVKRPMRILGQAKTCFSVLYFFFQHCIFLYTIKIFYCIYKHFMKLFFGCTAQHRVLTTGPPGKFPLHELLYPKNFCLLIS